MSIDVLTNTGLTEIRWHGRGGQGVVTASHVLAEAALAQGRYFQSFPEFGPERSGAPIIAYTRLSDEPVLSPSAVAEPDIVIVLDPSLIGRVDMLAGVKHEGLLLVNTPTEPERLRAALTGVPVRIATVDATRIARDCLKRNLPNVPTLGALVRVLPLVSMEALGASLERQLSGRMAPAVVQQNMEALRRGHDEVRYAVEAPSRGGPQ